jgi:outer membrane protein OmpA-like peptidoglycan-associated protein
MPLRLAVEMVAPLNLDVDRARLDLDGRRMVITADRPLAQVEIEVFGEGGASIGVGGVQVPDLDEVELRWDQSGGEALKLVVTARDSHDLMGQLILSPWSYAIPHDDVVFTTGSAQVTPEEAPKLESAWAELQEVLARYGDVVEVRLYVAGFTDTVGDHASNQALSERRAHAIAGWFRQRGFAGAIAYQGFGEDALAAGTDDEVDEPLNRRALYILAAEAPPVSDALPRAAWRSL